MILAIASGKGGTGKTTIAAALARTWDAPRLAVDMDVEAPNLHLLLSPTVDGAQPATLDVPVVLHPENCDGCGACSDICAFNAIVTIGKSPVVFSELCHGCDGCLALVLIKRIDTTAQYSRVRRDRTIGLYPRRSSGWRRKPWRVTRRDLRLMVFSKDSAIRCAAIYGLLVVTVFLPTGLNDEGTAEERKSTNPCR